MTSEGEDEKKLKRCLHLIIDVIDVKSLSFGKPSSEKQLLSDIQQAIVHVLDEYLPSLSLQSKNYVLDTLTAHHFEPHTQQFSKPFTKEILNNFLEDVESRFNLLDACSAAWNGKESIVNEFVEKYPRLVNKSGLYGTTLLYSAARNNHLNLVKYLIDIGKCSVNAQNMDYLDNLKKPTTAAVGSTALHAACFQGHLSIVKYLIEHGADYFITNAFGETPIDNGQKDPKIRKFFNDLLIFTYTKDLSTYPKSNILTEIENRTQPIIDCIWEYKPLADNRWFIFTSDASRRLQETLSIDCDTKLTTEIDLKASRDSQKIFLVNFLLKRRNDELENAAWIRCRGSSMLNFRCYAQWQLMFMKCPTGVAKGSLTTEIFEMKSSKIQLNSWYNANSKVNFLFERAMNYRRKYISIKLDFINDELIMFDLENFTFTNEQGTIEGFLRWIPKLLRCDTQLPVTNKSKLSASSDVILLTRSYVRQAEANGDPITADDISQYNLNYDNNLGDDILDLSNQSSMKGTNSNQQISLIYGNLLEEKTDVIVINISSKYLLDGVHDAGGKSFSQSVGIKSKQKPKQAILSVPAEGKLQCKAVYLVDWRPNKNSKILCQSIEELVSNVIEIASNENYTSIAFPAIGCGEHGCSIDLVAATLINQVKKELTEHPMRISFVIQQDRGEIYNAFEQKMYVSQKKADKAASKTVFIKLGESTLEVIKGDITQQKADVVIGSSSSGNLLQALVEAGGPTVETAYMEADKANPNALLILTPGGNLQCQNIFFFKWEPNKDSNILRQSVIDLIWNVVQHALAHNFSIIAFPAIGCGEHGCAVDIIVKTMVREMKHQMQARKLNWHVKFVVQPNLPNVYDEFCKQILSLDQDQITFEIPHTWESLAGNKIRYSLPKNRPEYKSIVDEFDQTMKKQYSEIIRIERIQNERWYMQFCAHAKEFAKRLGENTEKTLYHGCPEAAAICIMEECFNRSFAGVNGTAYGVGVYFSLSASYSHGYTKTNSKGERCMFVARVLVGKTTLGNSSMKTRPLGFDSTTDGNHIFVTYHDAQAYADYLITYR